MITVVFSSFNGERTLAAVLDAFERLHSPVGGWKLVAVDNGSTDGTADILRSYVERMPLQLLSVTTKGKNHALNAALEFIAGELIVFTDDDVIPEPSWLCHLHECARAHPEYDVFGGAILPRWPRAPDSWIVATGRLGMIYAVTDAGQKNGAIQHGRVWGPNMAVTRRVLDAGIRFNVNVGPDGTESYAMGSETEFTGRLAQHGYKAWFCADAQVEHIIRENQLARRWVLKRFFRSGRGDYLAIVAARNDPDHSFRSYKWLYRRLAVDVLKATGNLASFNVTKARVSMSHIYHSWGGIYQARLLNAQAKSEQN